MQTRLNQIWLRATLTMSACAFTPACVVEDRNFDEEFAQQQSNANDGEDSDATSDETEGPSPLCQDYCDKSEAVCTEPYGLFKDSKSCLPMCANLELALQEATEAGEKPDPKNTIACRLEELEAAGGELDDQCPRAAIASQSCGSPCETYCRIYPKICGAVTAETTDQAECERQCAAVPMTPSFSIDGNYLDDSIQCRLIHLATASINEQAAIGHCKHARLASPEKCGYDNPANCENYCNTLAVACTGDVAQYASKETCLKTCAALPLGVMSDRTTNTVACRHYHAYTALGHPEIHCEHAGPTTDGHCGVPEDNANCEAYCKLAQSACKTEFNERYAQPEECMAECLPLPGSTANSHYPPLPPDGGSEQVVQYLILAATKVLGNESGASCDDVFEPNFGLRL